MKAYCIVFERIHDPEAFAEYRRLVMPTLEAYGGRFLVRGGSFAVLEGDLPYERIVILEFPSRQAADEWYASPEYQGILPMRVRATTSQFTVVDGVAEV
jgi:uncharacterized protein (DUF1330 family)